MDLLLGSVRLIDVILGTEIDSTNLSLEEALKTDVLLAYEAEVEALTREHGGPVPMITPQLYAWKGSNWISAIEFMDANRPGFWEKMATPWGPTPG